MNSTQAGLVLQHIRGLAATHRATGPPDAQLLKRFIAQRDEAAFAALVRRHGPMVLNVCRSVLHHEQDAEDAFQATVLVLARKADSIRHPEAVASWLCEVAYNVAVKAQADAARRRVHQRRATPFAPADPTLDMTLRDLRRVLHEELRRLPDKYRLPLILCYLEGRSQEEAAGQLGWSKGTFRGRLDRGRAHLRRRLAARGVSLSALLCATAVAPQAAAEALVDSVVRAAVGGAASAALSARVSALAEGVVSTMYTSKLKIVTAVLLAVGLVAGAGALARQALAAREQPVERQKPEVSSQKPKPAAAPPPAADEKGDSIEMSGRVVDPAGKPVAGAKVFFARTVLAFHRDPPPPPPRPATTTDAQGRFRFRVRRTGYLYAEEKADWLQGGLVAVAQGYGPGWGYNDSVEKLAGVTIKLIKDVPIAGRVLNLEGKPVAGVSVRVRSYHLRDGDLKAWVEALKARKEPYAAASLGSMNPAYQLGLARPVVTGADGTFRLTGVGAERVVTLRFEGPTIATSEVYVVTRDCPTVVVPRDRKRPERGNHVYHGPKFDHVVAPTMPIVGSVRARDTGKPLAGVNIRAQLYSAYGYHGPHHYIHTTTDKEGRYRLVGLPRLKGHYLWVTPAPGQPYLPPERKTTGVSAGLDPLRVDFELKRGVLIRGRVTDKETGQPLWARVEYFAFADNPHLKQGGALHGLSFQTRTTPDGSFTLVALPGRGLVAARAAYKETYSDRKRYLINVGADKIKGPIITHLGPWLHWQFNTVVEISPARNAESIRQDIALDPGTTVTGTIVGPDGKPVAGVSISGAPGTVAQVHDLPTAKFRLRSIDPEHARAFFFRHRDKKLGAAVLLKGHQPMPVTVRLQKCATLTGRILDRDGQPCPNLDLTVMIHKGQLNITQDWGGLFAGKTGKDGRFRIEGVIPGLKIGLQVWKNPRFVDKQLVRELSLEAGEVKNLGDVKVEQE
jgi:RNA polymerase sigma factor (sigma-70 family)